MMPLLIIVAGIYLLINEQDSFIEKISPKFGYQNLTLGERFPKEDQFFTRIFGTSRTFFPHFGPYKFFGLLGSRKPSVFFFLGTLFWEIPLRKISHGLKPLPPSV